MTIIIIVLYKLYIQTILNLLYKKYIMNSIDEEIIEKPLDNTSLPNTFYSSLIFLTNVAHNLFYENYLYAAAFMLLTITSLIHHANTTKLTYVFDKLACIIVVLYGGYFFYNKCLNIKKPIQYVYATIIIITFLLTLFLYYYGFQCKHYCFSLDDNVAQFYHVLMHMVSSLGHHLIINFSTF
jgi:hypothetical protein